MYLSVYVHLRRGDLYYIVHGFQVTLLSVTIISTMWESYLDIVLS
jgi:hypothetical protein